MAVCPRLQNNNQIRTVRGSPRLIKGEEMLLKNASCIEDLGQQTFEALDL